MTSLSRNGAINATALYEKVAFPIAAGSTSVFFTVNASSHAGYYTGMYAPASSGSYQVNKQQHPPGPVDAVVFCLISAKKWMYYVSVLFSIFNSLLLLPFDTVQGECQSLQWTKKP